MQLTFRFFMAKKIYFHSHSPSIIPFHGTFIDKDMYWLLRCCVWLERKGFQQNSGSSFHPEIFWRPFLKRLQKIRSSVPLSGSFQNGIAECFRKTKNS